MERPRFVIEPTDAESMAKQSGFSSVIQLLPSLLRDAQTLARPPISSYPVAAAGLAADGRIFIGVNLEFPGVPLHHSVHAEQFLATNLALHRNPHIRFIAVSAAPCGHCRQFLQEIRGAPDIGIFFPAAGSDPDLHQTSPSDFKPLSQFLPQRFGPDDLLDKETPLLVEPHDNGLVLAGKKGNPIGGNPCNGASDFEGDDLVMAALAAANGSHAPYSGCPSGVALADSEGKVYRGSYMESAAFNPSVGPVQAALVAYIVGGGGCYDRIVGGAMVEKGGAAVVQEHTAGLLLKLVSPECEFRVVHCRSAAPSNGRKSPLPPPS